MRRLHATDEGQRRQIQMFHVDCMRQICGVRVTVPADMLMLELGLEPLQWHWWSQALQLWNQLASMPDERLHKRIAMDDIADAVRRQCFF